MFSAFAWRRGWGGGVRISAGTPAWDFGAWVEGGVMEARGAGGGGGGSAEDGG